ncbi:activator of Hsp90 ATPase 1 family protein (plasmid) [Rhizobium etli 8C-3]|uniref:Activator of Hsp90 ATPase 1 family protein n=1 Tax=Rhizobium etli 8C-3 TaxID=538025 RepID=A0A1L5PCS2_RHIET|nr:SRPBCC domain-containing protein [Rhizobium etli]APO77915.1 activator of Hsp90 ATPase 1 family protein [Rhizobium etli 8C-3]
MSELELTVNRKIAAPREKVFAAWLSAEMLAKFMQTPTHSNGPSRVSVDAVKGGRFSIVMLANDREIPHTGTFLEIDPYSRLSFTWESPYSLEDSIVTIDLAAIDANTTEITLRQVKFQSDEARLAHIGGWNAVLNKLEEAIA